MAKKHKTKDEAGDEVQRLLPRFALAVGCPLEKVDLKYVTSNQVWRFTFRIEHDLEFSGDKGSLGVTWQWFPELGLMSLSHWGGQRYHLLSIERGDKRGTLAPAYQLAVARFLFMTGEPYEGYGASQHDVLEWGLQLKEAGFERKLGLLATRSKEKGRALN